MTDCLTIPEIQAFFLANPDILWTIVKDMHGVIDHIIAKMMDFHIILYPHYEIGADSPHMWCLMPQGEPV